MSLLQTIESWFKAEASAAVAFLKPIVSAYIANLEAVGIKDIENFLEAVGPIALQAGVAAAGGGLGGVAIRDAVVAAITPIAVSFGANATHDLFASVANTTVELQHQSQLAGTATSG